MTLQTNVTTRISAALLIELTNQGDRTATTINTTVLDAAVADAQAEFLDEVGLAYDDTVAQHVRAGVMGVQYYLQSYLAIESEAFGRLRDRWQRTLGQLGRSLGANRRIMPQTSAVTLPSTPVNNALPTQDKTRWRDYVPNMPGGSQEQDDDC